METQTYVSVHHYIHEDVNGDVIDAEVFCSDSCHYSWCLESVSFEYKGWNGCHEINAPQWCVQCQNEIK